MICSVCCFEFSKEDGKKNCSACLGSKCAKIKCPRCGYEMPAESSLSKFIQRVVKKVWTAKNS